MTPLISTYTNSLHPWVGVRNPVRTAGPIFFRQFGGTKSDLFGGAPVVLTTGEIAVVVHTKSQSFDGLDLSAYTDGSTYYARGICIINPVTLRIVRSYWFSSSGGDFPAGPVNNNGSLIVDASDNLYLLIQNNAAYTVKVRKIESAGMTLVADSATIAAGQYLADFSLYDGNFYIATSEQGVGGEVTAKIRISKVNATTLAVTASVLSGTSSRMITQCIATSAGIFVWTSAWWLGVTKFNLATLAFSAEASQLFGDGFSSGLGYQKIFAYDSSIYIAGLGGVSGVGGFKVRALKQSDLSTKAGWSDYFSTYATGGTADIGFEEAGLDIDADGRMWVCGQYRKNYGVDNWCRLRLREINPTTGAAISSGYAKYPDDSYVATASATSPLFGSNCKRVKIADNKYLWLGNTTSALTGFANLGADDCFAMLTDVNGKLLS